MNESTMLIALKTDLGISSGAYDQRLRELLKAAEREIETEGIALDTSDLNDADLVVAYARYLWDKRKEDAGMPRSLRWRLNNRLFSGVING